VFRRHRQRRSRWQRARRLPGRRAVVDATQHAQRLRLPIIAPRDRVASAVPLRRAQRRLHAREHHIERAACSAGCRILPVGAGRALGRQREHVAAMDGAGKGHVKQAETFIEQFLALLRLALGRAVDAARAAVGVAEQIQAGLTVFAMRPHQRQKDDGKLQALAGVQAHQAYPLVVRFDPQLLRLGGLLVAVADRVLLLSQPRQQRLDAGHPFGLRLQQLGEVAQIRQDPFATRGLQKTRGQVCDQRRDHDMHALAAPAQQPVMELPGDGLPRRRIIAPLTQFGQAAAPQTCRRSGAQRRLVVAVGDAVQHEMQFARGVAGENTAADRSNAGHGALLQQRVQGFHLLIAGQQHRDVRGLQRPSADAMTARLQHLRNLVGAHTQRQRLALLAAFRGIGEIMHAQGARDRLAVHAIRCCVLAAARPHRLIADFRRVGRFGVAQGVAGDSVKRIAGGHQIGR